MRALKLSVGAALLCLLAACVTPKNFEERLATGYQDVTEARATSLTLGQMEKITVEDVENIGKQADTAREGLDIAVTLGPIDGKEKLDSTITILGALKAYLAKMQNARGAQ